MGDPHWGQNRAMDDHVTDEHEDLGEELENRADDIIEFVAQNSGRPSVDAHLAEQLLEEATPAHAAEELRKMVDGFKSGAGAATGRNSTPATGDSPTDGLPDPSPD